MSIIYRIVFAMLCLSLLNIGTSQVSYEQSYEYDYFGKLNSTKNFIYTNNGINKEFAKSQLKLYSHSGKFINEITLEGKTSPEVQYAGTAGDVTIFALDRETYLFVDASGNEIDSKTFEGADKVKNEEMLFTKDGFVVVQQVKVKKVGVGLRVRKFTPDGNEEWLYENFPEKGKYNFLTCHASANGNISILHSKGGMTYDKGLIVLSGSGEELRADDLKIEDPNFSPSQFKESPDGTLHLIAYRYKDTSASAVTAGLEVPHAMVILQFDSSTGEQKKVTTLDYVEFQSYFGYKRPDGTPVYTQNAPVLEILDIITYQGKNYFVAESFLVGMKSESIPSTTSGVPPTTVNYNAFNFLDYYLIECESPKSNAIRIWKPERSILIERSTFYTAESQSRKLLLDNDMFSYQGFENGKIISRGFSQMHHYFTTIDLGTKMESVEGRTFWSLPLNAELNSYPLRVKYGVSTSLFSKYFSNEGILSAGDNYLLYSYDYRTNQLAFSTLNF